MVMLSNSVNSVVCLSSFPYHDIPFFLLPFIFWLNLKFTFFFVDFLDCLVFLFSHSLIFCLSLDCLLAFAPVRGYKF